MNEYYDTKNDMYESRNDLGLAGRKRMGSEYNPLESIQNKQSHFGAGISDIDKKIQ